MRTRIAIGISSLLCLVLVFVVFGNSFLSNTFISPIPESVLAKTFDSPPTVTPSPTQTPPTVTPTPSPTATPTPLLPITFASGADLDKWFDQYSKQYSIDRSLLHKIARCESGFRTDAINANYAGMYQFSEQAWLSARSRMGLDTNKDLRFNAEEVIKTAAYIIANNGTSSWPNCNS